AWDLDLGLAGVVAAVFAAAARIARRAAWVRGIDLVLRREPVGGPLPGVADHVVHAIAVARKRAHRRRAREAVALEVLVGELALPSVGLVLAARRELVAPGVLGAVEPAARGVLPLSLGGQLLAGPLPIGQHVLVGHVHHRMIVEARDRTARAVW